MKNYVITMMNHTQSVQSSERCIRSGEKYGEEIKQWSAITPENKPLVIAAKEKIPLKYFQREGNRYSRYENVISAFLSHYSLWKHCATVGEPIRIFEHDAVVMTQLPQILMFGKKCVSLGQPSYGKWNTPQNMGLNRLTSKTYFPGAHAYQLTPEGAQELVERARVDAGPTDVYLHIDRFPWLEEYYPWPVIADDYFTTIQSQRGCLAKHSYQSNPEKYEIL